MIAQESSFDGTGESGGALGDCVSWKTVEQRRSTIAESTLACFEARVWESEKVILPGGSFSPISVIVERASQCFRFAVIDELVRRYKGLIIGHRFWRHPVK